MCVYRLFSYGNLALPCPCRDRVHEDKGRSHVHGQAVHVDSNTNSPKSQKEDSGEGGDENERKSTEVQNKCIRIGVCGCS